MGRMLLLLLLTYVHIDTSVLKFLSVSVFFSLFSPRLRTADHCSSTYTARVSSVNLSLVFIQAEDSICLRFLFYFIWNLILLSQHVGYKSC